jgi:outer membrane receptor protein involved in Fe transport
MSDVRKRILVCVAVSLALLLFAGGSAFAGLGKIAGVVKDAKTGEALIGANVTIEGTTMGASTDAQGRYFVINVPVGTFTVRASYLGYKIVRQENIRVVSDLTTEVNFSLETTVIEGQEIVVVAQAPLVEKSLTATVSTYGASELNNQLPVATLQDILNVSASVYRGFIRGGNLYETKTLVDGVDVTDSYFSKGVGAFGGEVGHTYQGMRPSDDADNSGFVQSASSLQEVQVFAGTFNAEYPNATAGVVNIVTKEGGQKYAFNIFNRTQLTSGLSHDGTNIYNDRAAMFAERDANLSSSNPNLVREGQLMTWTVQDAKDQYNYDPETGKSLSRSHETSLTFSGPLTSKGGFFLEGKYNQLDEPLPFARTKNVGGSLKLNYNLTHSQKLTGMFQLNDGGELFNFVNWKYNPRYKYFMNGAPRYKDLNTVGYLKWTNALNAKTFYEVTASTTNILTEVGYPDDNGDGFPELNDSGDFIKFSTLDEYIKYVGGNGTAGSENGYKFGTTEPVFFSSTLNPTGWQKLNQMEFPVNGVTTNGQYLSAYPIALYQKFSRKKYNMKADFTSQVTYNHQLKGGVNYTYHTVDVNSLQSELGGRGIDYPTSKWHVNQWKFHPQELAFYLQDRIEFEGLIVNVGGRVDGFNNDTQLFTNEWDPLQRVVSSTGDFVSYEPLRGDKVGFNFVFSPRVGVSHPVTEKLAMHYSFGRFFQYPNYASVYQDYNFTDYAASPNIVTVRPDQDPVRSTNYELGTQWSPTNDLLVNATAYYRDVENTKSTAYTLTTAENQGLVFYTSWGYSDARGIEIELSKRPGKWWGGRISYAYTYIKESVGAGGTFKSTFATTQDSVNYARLPWDQIELIPSRERNVLVTSGGTNTLAGGYDRPHRINGTLQLFFPAQFNATFLGEWTSGFYYQLYENENGDPFFSRNLNLKVGPSTFFVNARVSKFLNFGGKGFELFVEGRNIFDHTNIRGIANSNANIQLERQIWELGRPNPSPSAPAGSRLNGPEQDPEGVLQQPTDIFGRLYYLNAREFYFGVNVNLR